MQFIDKRKNVIKKIFSFFPFQLIISQLKYNQLILLSWIFPFAVIIASVGYKMGIPSIFLTPEYLGKESFLSYLFTGLAIGSFIVAFHLSSYVVMIHRFPFVVKMAKPFYQYSLNNSTIPTLYIIIYLSRSFYFQYFLEIIPAFKVIINLLSSLLGIIFFIYLTFTFFLIFFRKLPQLHLLNKLRKILPIKFFGKLSENDHQQKLKEAEIYFDDKEKTEYYFSSFF